MENQVKVLFSPEALFSDLDGKSIILHIGKENYYTLDEVATEMWKLLQEKENVPDVLQRLTEIYAVDRQTLEKDLNDLIQKFVSADLLTIK
jgi:hypothetical protein